MPPVLPAKAFAGLCPGHNHCLADVFGLPALPATLTSLGCYWRLELSPLCVGYTECSRWLQLGRRDYCWAAEGDVLPLGEHLEDLRVRCAPAANTAV